MSNPYDPLTDAEILQLDLEYEAQIARDNQWTPEVPTYDDELDRAYEYASEQALYRAEVYGPQDYPGGYDVAGTAD